MTVIRRVLVVCALLAPATAVAQTPSGGGAPVVFFSLFGPNGSELQKFYADVFDWKVTVSGDVARGGTIRYPRFEVPGQVILG